MSEAVTFRVTADRPLTRTLMGAEFEAGVAVVNAAAPVLAFARRQGWKVERVDSAKPKPTRAPARRTKGGKK